MKHETEIRYLSTFTGIGGFELGIQNACAQPARRDQNNAHRGKPHKGQKRKTVPVCVGFSEIDRYATQIYQRHFPGHTNYGDITKVDAKKLPDFDLFVGGFPCQAFSIAGKRRGFEDTRGTLFFEVARILAAKQPRLCLLENVKGLLSHDEGRTFFTIIAALDDLGYDLQWQVLNSKNHGVPQNRERVFIVGHLRGTPRPEVFPFGEERQEDSRTLGQDISPCLDAHYYKGFSASGHQSKQRLHIAHTLKARQDSGIDAKHPQTLIELTPAGTGDAQRIYDAQGIGRTLKGESGGQGGKMGLYKVGMRIRRLTPVECERLQGFPDGWTEGVSDTQRYKCLGNAVTVNVIADIVERLLQSSRTEGCQ